MTVIAADVERLLVEWALAHDEIAAIFDDRIYTEIPGRDPGWPLLRFQRFGGGPTDRVAWLDAPRIQVDVWGGPKSTARLGMATVLGHLASDLPGAHDDAVVSAVEVGAMQWLPDPSFSTPRPRYSADVVVWLRPTT